MKILFRCITTAVCLALFAGPAAAEQSIMGDWLTQRASARVHIAPCGPGDAKLCGVINWLWDDASEDGPAKKDSANPDPKLRSRPLVGTMLLRNFRQTKDGVWSGGQVYTPKNGQTHDATLTLDRRGRLIVEGCVLMICQKQAWLRAETVAGAACSEKSGGLNPAIPR